MKTTRFLSIETLDGIITLDRAQIINSKNFLIEIKWYYSPFDYDIEKLHSIVKSQVCVGRNFERTEDYIIFSFPICGIREMKMLQFESDCD